MSPQTSLSLAVAIRGSRVGIGGVFEWGRGLLWAERGVRGGCGGRGSGGGLLVVGTLFVLLFRW